MGNSITLVLKLGYFGNTPLNVFTGINQLF
jgi:hypothetical protein